MLGTHKSGYAVIALGLAFASSGAHAAERKGCQLAQLASLDVAIAEHAVLVPVTVAGTEVLAVLDTGSLLSVISKTAAEELKVPLSPLPQDVPKLTYGKDTITSFAEVKDLRFGGVRFSKAQMSAVDRDFGSFSGKRVIGAVSMDMLMSVDVELDLARSKVNLFSKEHCPRIGAYWATSFGATELHRDEIKNLYFLMELDGKRIEATLSPGQEMTSLPTAVTRRLYDFGADSPGVERTLDLTGRVASSYKAMTISADDLRIDNARVELVDRDRCGVTGRGTKKSPAAFEKCLGAHPLRLGMNVLRRLRLYIATKEEMLYYTPSAPPVDGAKLTAPSP